MVAGIRLTPENGEQIRRRISVMPEAPGLYLRLSVAENLECFADLYEVPGAASRIDFALRAVNLADRARDTCGSLSKGLRQRVALARAMLPDPRWRRVRAIYRKEGREYRRRRTIVFGMAILPLIFLIQPLISVFALPAGGASTLAGRHELLYLLAIPALVPATLAAYTVVGERQQGTLEPALSTPVLRQEFLLGKALAVLVPSIAISYGVFIFFVVCVELFAQPGVAPALLRGGDLLAQLVFTPLLAGWAIWLGIGISARATETRVAQQLGVLANLPSVAITTLLATGTIHPSLPLAIGAAVLLIILNRVGWRVTSAMFDRERLVTGTR